MICTSECLMEPTAFLMNSLNSNTSQHRLCSFENDSLNTSNNASCGIECKEDIERNSGCLYTSFTFWSFVILMSIGTIGFNVTNSISDAICFDVIGKLIMRLQYFVIYNLNNALEFLHITEIFVVI